MGAVNPRGKKNECVICLSDIHPPHTLLSPYTCSHDFHKECIKKWYGNCPTCRARRVPIPINTFCQRRVFQSVELSVLPRSEGGIEPTGIVFDPDSGVFIVDDIGNCEEVTILTTESDGSDPHVVKINDDTNIMINEFFDSLLL